MMAVMRAGCALMGLAIAAAAAPLTEAQSPPAGQVEAGRTRVNFNADWRFKLGKVEGGEASTFDDAAWQHVGLPHSFSMPYFRAPDFYVGDGWYRKRLMLPAIVSGKRYALEFEGAFQDAHVYVNGVEVGHHRGGYTGFPVDITKVVHAGENVVAVKVNNEWRGDLAPRAGEHVFSGGLYRDVWLVTSDAVHVPWTGTRVTTPDLSAASGKVAVETEVRNDGPTRADVLVQTRVVDHAGHAVATLPEARVSVEPGAIVIARELSAPIARPRLWSPETPALYRAVTTLSVAGKERDRFETDFGFRWFEWTADRGFFLNGKHRYFKGANVHQDQAGWGDAVTNGAITRDVQLIKDAGFDFIRGSHYPHDPHFAEATDKLGMLFLSEAAFWGTAGFKHAWGAPAYPTEVADRAGFEASIKQQLAEMIRINRNHPSIVVWGMDNEVFFTKTATLPEVRRLLKDMVALSHELDPSRPAAIDGAQRGDIDKLGDIAGQNGDGASLFPNPGIPSFVAEYGSTMEDRPGTYAPGWGDLPATPGADKAVEGSWRLPWRAGEAIWAGFDHGSVAGKRFGGMGLIDYFRLPKRQYYWYRNAYAKTPPPMWPVAGTPASLTLTTSAPTIARADGTDDVQLIVSVVDAAGKRLSNSPPVRLTIESGPGELPTGRTIDFAAGSDIAIRDGQAAIAMRSWQAGVTRVRATSPGLKDAVATVRTVAGPAFVAGKTPLVADRPYVAFVTPMREHPGDQQFGPSNPTFATTSVPDHSPQLVNDGNPATYWAPIAGDTVSGVTIDLERIVEIHRLTLTFPQGAGYGLIADVQDKAGNWVKLVEQVEGQDDRQTRTLDTDAVAGRIVRVRLRMPSAGAAIAGLSEMSVMGALKIE